MHFSGVQVIQHKSFLLGCNKNGTTYVIGFLKSDDAMYVSRRASNLSVNRLHPSCIRLEKKININHTGYSIRHVPIEELADWRATKKLGIVVAHRLHAENTRELLYTSKTFEPGDSAFHWDPTADFQ